MSLTLAGMTPEQIRAALATKSTHTLARELGVSQSSVLRFCDRNGIQRPRRSARRDSTGRWKAHG